MAACHLPTLAVAVVFAATLGGVVRPSMAGQVTAHLGERPVMKVVRLLQDMKTELQTELDDDKAVHGKLSCWCKTNNQEKTKAIELGTAQVAQLESSMSADAAKVKELKAKRATAWDEIQADKKALEDASALRMKENKAFHGQEVDLIEAVKACKQAIVVLGEHHPALTQVQFAARVLQRARVPDLVSTTGALGAFRMKMLRDFLKNAQGTSSFLSIPGFQSYRPQSGQIFGVLKQMQQEFESNLSEEQKAELKAQEDYEALAAAKRDEIASGEKQVVQLDADVADLGEKAAQEAKELSDASAQLALDKEFLADLEGKCAATDEEFEARTKSRLEEIAAVEETISILNADEAFDVFGKSLGSTALVEVATSRRSFAQTRGAASQRRISAAQHRAASVLLRAGTPRLALLALAAQDDAFVKVKAAIDSMVAELATQQKDEVADRDECISEFASNKASTEAAYDKKASLDTSSADFRKEVDSLTMKISELTSTMAELQEQMKRASENREAENAAFQRTVEDQRLTQIILEKALGRMKQVYTLVQQRQSASDDSLDEPLPGAAHIATSGNHTNAGNGPARFTKYEQNAGGRRVVAMIEKVIADSKKTEEAALASENDSQTAYESFMKDSNRSLLQQGATKTDMTEAKANAMASLGMVKADLRGTVKTLEDLDEVLGSLHKSCDFLMKNFDARQEARAKEMEALKEAKAILSGMN